MVALKIMILFISVSAF